MIALIQFLAVPIQVSCRLWSVRYKCACLVHIFGRYLRKDLGYRRFEEAIIAIGVVCSYVGQSSQALGCPFGVPGKSCIPRLAGPDVAELALLVNKGLDFLAQNGYLIIQ